MGGYSQSAKIQGQSPKTGTMNYAPLKPFEVPSTGEEKVAQGWESATKSITDSLMGAMSAKYMNDQKIKSLSGIGQTGSGVDFNQPVQEVAPVANQFSDDRSWIGKLFGTKNTYGQY